MQFQKQDLIGDHYHWGEADNLFKGQPSRRLFDRANGDQVLFLINFYGASTERFTIQTGRLIESAISGRLPLEAKSEISVYHWIQQIDLANKLEAIT